MAPRLPVGKGRLPVPVWVPVCSEVQLRGAGTAGLPDQASTCPTAHPAILSKWIKALNVRSMPFKRESYYDLRTEKSEHTYTHTHRLLEQKKNMKEKQKSQTGKGG